MFIGYIYRLRYVRMVGSGAFVALILLLLATIIPVSVHHDAAEGLTPIESETVLTIDTSHSSANLDIVVSSGSGSFVSTGDDNSVKFGVTTTNVSGYTLTLASSDSTGALVNDITGGTFATIKSAISASDFGEDSELNGKWGILPSKYNSEVNTTFHPAPTDGSITIDETSAANSIANEYSIGIGARTDYLLASGVYGGTFVLTATARPAPYTINYLDNTSGTTTSILDSDTGTSNYKEVEISRITPTKTGYTFAGWCDEATTVNADKSTTCSGTTYKASSEASPVYVDVSASSIVNLHAVWNANIYNVTINFAGEGVGSVEVSANGYATQSVTTSGGTVNLSHGVTYSLTMIAESSKYELASWTINDHNYGTLGTPSSANPITFTTNSNSNSAIITVTGVKSIVTFNKALSDAGKSPDSTTNYYYIQDVDATTCEAVDIGQKTTLTDKRDLTNYTVAKLLDGNCWMTSNLKLGYGKSSMTLTSDTSNVQSSFNLTGRLTNGKFTSSNFANNTSQYYCRSDGYGCYYNWYTATGGSGSSSTGTGVTVNYDICPANWTMPTGGNNGDFEILYHYYYHRPTSLLVNPTSLKANTNEDAPGLLLNGIYTTGTGTSGRDVGTYGFYWTRTSSSGYNAYNFGLSTTITSGTEYNTYKFYGESVRCLVKEVSTKIPEYAPLDNPIAGITTMQDFGKLSSEEKTVVKNSMDMETAYTIVDERDNQTYTISKLLDGNIWMTQNLKLGKESESMVLTSGLSDVEIEFTLDGKLSEGKFSSENIDSSQFYCTDAYGCYYNWYTAVAGSGDSTSSATANNSICPVGWSVPDSATLSGLNSNSRYGGTLEGALVVWNPSITTENINGVDTPGFLLGGLYIDSGASAVGRTGYYWSRTSSGSTGVSAIHVSATTVYAPGNLDKSYGVAVRCVLKT